MKLSEILRAGKQRIETLGWVQGDEAIFRPGKGCCAATAITFGGFGSRLSVAISAIAFLKAANGIDPNVGIGNWNDAPERTVGDVLAAYDKAIAAAEAQEQANV